ncbi:MAG: sugar transferase [Bryobacterales bacterium]|nr:sugar transferase [Bryobacterales bacterium]
MIRLFQVFVPVGVLALVVSEFLIAAASFLFGTYLVLGIEFESYLLLEQGWLRIAIVVGSIMLSMHFVDLYPRYHVRSRSSLLQDLCQVIGLALLAQGLVSYALPPVRLGRGIMLVGSLVALASLFLWRLFYSSFVGDRMARQRLLFVGANPIVLEVAGHIAKQPHLGLSIAGYLLDQPATDELPGGPVLGSVNDVRRVAHEIQPARIVVGLSERRNRMPVNDLLDLRLAGFSIEEAGTTYEMVSGRVCTKELRPSHLIFSGALAPRQGQISLQQTINLVVSLTGTALALPVMALVAVAVRVTSPGPVLFRQTRVGLNGRNFTLYKFRSMRADAEAETGAVWASRNDPRVTPIGRWLRILRLDELPQFFNVLRGDMSLVGPRPERPEFVETLSELIPFYRQRLAVKPGITGWAQINYKYGDTVEDTIHKLEYDLYYIKNISPSLDAYIIFQTLKTIVLSRGAQ